MAEESSVIELQIDISEAIANTSELNGLFDGMKRTAQSVSAAVTKGFQPMVSGMKDISSMLKSITASMSELINKLSETASVSKGASASTGLFDGITGSVENALSAFKEIENVEKLSGKMGAFLAEVMTAPNMGNFVESMFPQSAEMLSTASQWANESLFPAITSALGSGNSVISQGLLSTVESMKGIFSGISNAFSGMSLGWGAVIAGIVALIVLLVTNWDTVKAAIISAWEAIKQAIGTAAEWINTTIIQPVVGYFTNLWNGIAEICSGIWDGIVSIFSGAVQWFGQLFGSIGQTFSDVFYNIGVIVSGCWEVIKKIWGIVAQWFQQYVIQPVAGFFTGLWSGIVNAAKQVWAGIQSVFSTVASFFGNIFSNAWAAVVKVFSAAGAIFENIKDGVLSVFKTVVNGLIDGINAVVSIPFKGINGAIGLIQSIEIVGLKPFAGLKPINVPQIPHLARGAVLPANRPFLAVVGDQRHGTNIEAPLATIQEAVAAVMSDHVSAMMAGFEALLQEQQATRRTIEEIEIGDTVIGQAVQRYNSKLAIINGR